MNTSNRPSPITALLQDTIREAVEAEQETYLTLERATGLARASIMRFVRGTQSLRLDMADRLAAYFNLELRPARKKR